MPDQKSTSTDALPDFHRWSCSRCSFEQPDISYPTCQMCHQVNSKKNDELSIFSSSEHTWICSFCTWYNRTENILCESCLQSKSSVRNHTLDTDETSFSSLIPRTVTVRNDQNQMEINLESKYQEIISYCKTIKTHFVDDQFIPSIQSLGSEHFNNVYQWLRISDIAPSSSRDLQLPWTVISSPQPNDIEQGALGNCWLLAALALITQRPRILQQILLTKTVNNEGIYLVRICHNGLWKTIMVDDCFPCTNQKQLVFSQAKGRQLYVPLIEKACAKLFGSYANLISGTLLEGLQLLTGSPCDYINLQSSNNTLDTDVIWAKLLSACESKLLIGASTGRMDISKIEYDQVHISSNHAFSILAAHTFPTCSSRFVLIRDPHARSNYTDERVTPTVLDQLRLINDIPRSSGAFWIYWPTFLRFFASIIISTYNENHFDVRYAGQFTRSSTQDVIAYQFSLTETTPISISLVYHRSSRKCITSRTQSFVLCDIDKKDSSYSIGKHENILKSCLAGFTYWTGSLRPGNYILIPFSISFWNENISKCDYTIVIHSGIPLDLTIEAKAPTVLADCLISAIVRKYHISTSGKDMMCYLTPPKIQSMMLIIENCSSTDDLTVETSMSQADFMQYSRKSVTVRDCIPPRYRQLIFMIESISEHQTSNYPTYNLTYQHTTHANHKKSILNNNIDDLHTPRLYL